MTRREQIVFYGWAALLGIAIGWVAGAVTLSRGWPSGWRW